MPSNFIVLVLNIALCQETRLSFLICFWYIQLQEICIILIICIMQTSYDDINLIVSHLVHKQVPYLYIFASRGQGGPGPIFIFLLFLIATRKFFSEYKILFLAKVTAFWNLKSTYNFIANANFIYHNSQSIKFKI